MITCDAVLDEVVPVLDALGVALAHQEDDGRGVGRGVVAEALLPIGLDLAGLGDLVDVALKRQRHHVGFQAVDDGAGLLARAAMGLLDGDVLAGLGLPILGEGLVDGFVELTRRVVGDVEQGGVGKHCARRDRGQSDCRRERQGCCEVSSWIRSPLWNTLNSI